MNEDKTEMMIGKNCKWNETIRYRTIKAGKRYPVIKGSHHCIITKKTCGLKHICDCFDNKGKLCFEENPI